MDEEGRLQRSSKDLGYGYLLGITFPKLSLKDSKVDGKGVHADEHVPKGQPICPLFGILYNLGKAKINYPKYSYQISDDIAIETCNEPGFFNHSCSPNAFINDDWIFEALCDIEQGDEIVIDYGTVDYFDYAFTCTCGADGCRKTFDGKVSADPEFQARMSRYFSPYLRARFRPE